MSEKKTEKKRRMKIKINSNGESNLVRVVDAETGQDINGIKRLNLSFNPKKGNRMEVKADMWDQEDGIRNQISMEDILVNLHDLGGNVEKMTLKGFAFRCLYGSVR